MGTLEQEAKERETLTTVLQDLKKIEPESLVRAEILGKELSFESGLPVFRRTLGLFRDLSECSLDGAPAETLSQLHGHARQAQSYFKQIRDFSIQQNPTNPASVRDSLINQLRDQWYTYYTAITPHIAYSVRRGTDFDELEREARGTLSLLKKLEADAKVERDKTLAEIQGALEKVRQAAAEAGVAQHSVHFKQEADTHARDAKRWLAAAALFGVVTMSYAVYSLGHQLVEVAANASTGRLLQLALSRIVVLSIMSFGLVWSARNYASSRHNFIVNRHRQNALSTFETFVKASGDEQTKNAVLLQATQCIFSPQGTGYTKSDGEASQGSQIVEIVRGVAGAKE